MIYLYIKRYLLTAPVSKGIFAIKNTTIIDLKIPLNFDHIKTLWVWHDIFPLKKTF